MQELEVVREKIQSKYRVVKTDEDLEWNRAIDLCTNIIKAHLSGENAAEIARSSRDTDFLSMIGILDKLSFFGGQRAGRELWNDKSRKVQDEDIASFNRDIEYLRDLIRKHMNDGWISVEDRLPTKEECKQDNNNFLVQVDSGERFSCEYDPSANGYDNPQWCCNIPVVAWQPLPEPYHPERSEE